MNIADLKKTGNRPRLHPNGFIQLDIQDNMRMHLWPEPGKVKGQETSTPIHDHIFDMRSYVLKGILSQVRYKFTLSHFGYPEFEIYMARYDGKSKSTLEPTGVLGNLSVDYGYSKFIMAGQNYFQDAFTFHESQPKEFPVVTLMFKERSFDNHSPRVLVPLGKNPDNSFDREAISEKYLWELIEEYV